MLVENKQRVNVSIRVNKTMYGFMFSSGNKTEMSKFILYKPLSYCLLFQLNWKCFLPEWSDCIFFFIVDEIQ